MCMCMCIVLLDYHNEHAYRKLHTKQLTHFVADV